MSIQLQMEEMPGYLAARFTGVGVPGEVSQRFELIAEQCRRANKDKLLIDITRCQINASVVDRYFTGKQSQIFARYRLKVVFVCTPEQIDPRKFGVLVARNRGVNVERSEEHTSELQSLRH